MLANSSADSALAAQSFIDWWKSAGVDYVIGEDAVNWLVDAPPVAQVQSVKAAMIEIPKSPPVPTPQLKIEFPDTIELLCAAVKIDTSLPGNNYGTVRALPHWEAGAEYLVISDFPEESELSAEKMGELPLLKNMLRAAGITAEQCSFAALAYTRPASGSIKDQDKAAIGTFIQHQIGLFAPRQIIVLGNTAAELLLGQDMMSARGQLLNINHIVGNKAAIATFHPRTLAARPILKAQAWRDLQMLMKKDSA